MTRVLTDDELRELSADELLLLWQRVQAVREVRGVLPGLRGSVVARLAEAVEAGRVSEASAAQISRELEKYPPNVVLAAHFREILPDRPALGAFPRRDLPAAPTLEEELAADPCRLADVLFEVLRFRGDIHQAVAAVLELADQAGIAQATADGVVTEALRTRRGTARRRTSRRGRLVG
jgi:hypothetical protein